MAGVRVQHTLEAIGAGGADGLVADHLPESTTGVLTHVQFVQNPVLRVSRLCMWVWGALCK